MKTTGAQPDWGAWSKEAVRLMRERNEAWMRDYGLQGCQYEWNLVEAQMVFSSGSAEVVADICVVGSISEAPFFGRGRTRLSPSGTEGWREFARSVRATRRSC